MMILNYSSAYYIPDSGIDYQRYVDLISIPDFVVLVLDILDFADSTNLNLYMDMSFDFAFCSTFSAFRITWSCFFDLVLI